MKITRVILPRDILSERMSAENAALRVTDLVIKHLRKKNASTQANPFGLPKSNYYAEAADTAQHEVHGNKFVVSVGTDSTDKDAPGRGISLHYHGGTVYPKKKALAMPIDPAVAGIWPSEYSRDHQLFKTPAGALGDAETGKILYILLPKATIPADPTVLPTDGEIADAATLGIGEVIEGKREMVRA